MEENRKIISAEVSGGDYLFHLADEVKPEALVRRFGAVSEEDVKAIREDYLKQGYASCRTGRTALRSFETLQKDGRQLFLSYDFADRLLTAAEDPVSAREQDFSDGREPAEGESAELFMYGLPMDPQGFNIKSELNTSGRINCGLLMAVRDLDQNVILIDGGHDSQFDDEGLEKLNAFLHEISGKKSGEEVVISCWYLTHSHDDHFCGFLRLLEAYPEEYRVKRVLMNLPKEENWPASSFRGEELRRLAALILAKEPGCLEVKAHSGQSLTVGGCRLDILYCWEDILDPAAGVTMHHSYNDMSTVVRISVRNEAALILGDISEPPADFLCSHYTEEELKCQFIQVAHHCFNPMPELYRMTAAEVHLFPQAEKAMEDQPNIHPVYLMIEPYIKKAYYSGEPDRTVGLELGNARENREGL